MGQAQASLADFVPRAPACTGAMNHFAGTMAGQMGATLICTTITMAFEEQAVSPFPEGLHTCTKVDHPCTQVGFPAHKVVLPALCSAVQPLYLTRLTFTHHQVRYMVFGTLTCTGSWGLALLARPCFGCCSLLCILLGLQVRIW